MATKKLKIRYIKADGFRISLTTGVWGGIANSGLISMAFFNERPVIPDSTDIEVDLETGLPVGKGTDNKDGDLVRELQNGILVDVNTAKVIVKWLESKIKEHTEVFNKK